MNRTTRMLPILLVALGALSLLAAGDRPERDGDEEPFDVATIFFELNHTDGDLGIHALIDGGPWKIMEMESPDEREKLKVTARGTLRQHGMTELFFESAEPPFDELDPADFFARFAEGEWEVSGVTIEGDELESTAYVRHVLAAPPGNVEVNGVTAAPNCDADPLPSVGEPVTISWDPVTTSHPTIGNAGPIEVVKYQLVVEREEPTLLILSLDLPPGITEFELPEGFTALGDEFKFEILVREASGNQTAIESCFEID